MLRRSLFSTLLASLMLLASAAQAQTAMLEGIAAVVDDDVVLISELSERIDAVKARIAASGTQAPPDDVLRDQVLERLIEERLQINLGLQAGVRVTDEEINQAIVDMAQRQNMAPDQFLQAVQNDGVSVRELRRQLRDEILITRVQQNRVNRRIQIGEQDVTNFLESEEGRFWASPEVNVGQILLPLSSAVSREDVEATLARAEELRRQARQGADFRQLAIAHSGGQNALQGGDLGWRRAAQLPGLFVNAITTLEPGDVAEPIRSDAGIHLIKLYDRRESRQVIEQSLVRHILLQPNEIRSDEETRRQLEAIRTRLQEGEDFTTLAREYSEDIGSALSGGELGWSMPGQFVPEFEAMIEQTDVGETSPAFRSQFGWHILRIDDRREQDFSREIMRHQAEQMLRSRRFDEELQVWLQELRDEAYIEIKNLDGLQISADRR